MITKALCVLAIIFSFIQPIQAKKQNITLIIPSQGNDYYLIAHQNENFEILTIPKETIMPVTCLKNQLTDTKDFSNNQTAIQCIQESIQKTFHISIDHYVVLNTKKIASTLNVTIHNQENIFDELSSFFLKQKPSLSFQDCIQLYQSMQSDLSILDCYRYYQLLKSSQFQYQKQYPIFLYHKDQMIPLSYVSFFEYLK